MAAILQDRRFVGAAAFLLVVYVTTLAISPKRVFWAPDEGAKWLQMHSVRLQGDLRYYVDFPAQRVDSEFRYLPHAGIFPRPFMAPDGSLYLAFETPVVFPLLSSVGLHLFGIAGIYVLPLLSGWLLAVVAGALAAAVCPGAGTATLLLVGLATPVWFYSVLFWEHTVAGGLAMVALAVVAFSSPWSLSALLAALLLLLAGASLRLEMLAFALALVVAWGISGLVMRTTGAGRREARPRRRSPMRAAAVYLGLLVAVTGAALFLQGSLTLRHNKLMTRLPQRLQPALDTLVQSPWSILDVFVHTSISEAPPASDAWVLTAGVGILLCIAAAFVRRVRWESALLFAGFGLVFAFSVSLLCVGETYRALHGLVPVAPFMVVAPYAWSGSRRGGRSYALVLIALFAALYCLASMVAISATYLENGRLAVGIEWGQRYMLTLYAVTGVLTVVAVQLHWRSSRPLWLRRAFVAGVAAMVLTAVAFEVRGNGMLYLTRVRLAVWERAMQQEGPIVTDVWWLPASFAVFYTEHEMYYVRRRGDVAGWIAAAARHGVKEFTFVGFAPAESKEFGAAGVRLVSQNNVSGLFLARFVSSDAGGPFLHAPDGDAATAARSSSTASPATSSHVRPTERAIALRSQSPSSACRIAALNAAASK